jgi:acetyl esterase/lipase
MRFHNNMQNGRLGDVKTSLLLLICVISHLVTVSSFSTIQLSNIRESQRSSRTSFFSTQESSEIKISPPSTKSNLIPLGSVGDWENLYGNWILRPPQSDEPPRAVLHFLGGALVGASPHITYRYMLERLAAKGYLIIATPFQLSFDHLTTCDEVIYRFEKVAPSIARQYGSIPVVGIGHSCGALLQLLINCLFPDTPRAANALISFNNKPVTEAVPFFEEIFAPLFTTIGGKNGTIPSGSAAMALSLQMAKAATLGK